MQRAVRQFDPKGTRTAILRNAEGVLAGDPVPAQRISQARKPRFAAVKLNHRGGCVIEGQCQIASALHRSSVEVTDRSGMRSASGWIAVAEIQCSAIQSKRERKA